MRSRIFIWIICSEVLVTFAGDSIGHAFRPSPCYPTLPHLHTCTTPASSSQTLMHTLYNITCGADSFVPRFNHTHRRYHSPLYICNPPYVFGPHPAHPIIFKTPIHSHRTIHSTPSLATSSHLVQYHPHRYPHIGDRTLRDILQSPTTSADNSNFELASRSSCIISALLCLFFLAIAIRRSSFMNDSGVRILTGTRCLSECIRLHGELEHDA